MKKTSYVVTFQPSGKAIVSTNQRSILELSAKAKVLIPTRCNGVAGCLMCKISVDDSASVTEPSQAERQKLGPMLDEGIRLACQTRPIGDVTVNVPEDRLKSVVRAQLERLKRQQEEDDWLA